MKNALKHLNFSISYHKNSYKYINIRNKKQKFNKISQSKNNYMKNFKYDTKCLFLFIFIFSLIKLHFL